ncbi:hypothetical protein AK812_SmicGene41770 [Symbiodinium microadriaticum]|uniref:Uncharacterized protein n=1 Tax=Symbiodinium microadriaticum TaxID=2951 RepID=A0A1Q9C5C9_SYMMI|nr:hypothetical protein AK812_SmicGene41770 [Symbiodinium microadriaticum]
MPWGCQLLGLTGTSASCWGISWLNALQQCVADTSRLFPARVVDFLLPVLSPDSTHPVFVAPFHRFLQEHWRSHSDLPPSSEHTLYGVHSCKATVLSWPRQLHLDPELRRLQGHHRPSAMEGSVRIYSRDDIGPMLKLQADEASDTDLSADGSDSDCSAASASDPDLLPVPSLAAMSGRGYRRGGSYGAAAGLAPAVADRPGPDLTQLEEVTDEELLAPGRETEGKAACLWDDGRCETGAGDKGRVDSTAGGAVPARAEEQGWGVRPLRRGAEGGAKDQEKRKSGRRGERDRSTRAVAEADAGTESPSV